MIKENYEDMICRSMIRFLYKGSLDYNISFRCKYQSLSLRKWPEKYILAMLLCRTVGMESVILDYDRKICDKTFSFVWKWGCNYASIGPSIGWPNWLSKATDVGFYARGANGFLQDFEVVSEKNYRKLLYYEEKNNGSICTVYFDKIWNCTIKEKEPRICRDLLTSGYSITSCIRRALVRLAFSRGIVNRFSIENVS